MFRALPARAVVATEEPLAELLRHLKAAQYHFITVTPATHARVLARPFEGPVSLRDIFGWNRPFDPGDLNPALLALLRAADALELREGRLRSRVRVASLGEDLLLHGAFPTDEADAVFFGPDTYRFTRFVQQRLPQLGRAAWLVDMGAGSGAGALASTRFKAFGRATLIDVNAAALSLAAVNLAAAGVSAETLLSDAVPAGADLVIANPPYMIDTTGRAYRDGGGLFGGAVSLAWAKQGLARLAPGGTMLLYTGAAYVDGKAPFLDALATACAETGSSLELDEIDPDLFGDELEQLDYAQVERIAAVGAVITVQAG